ncbi:hypothetical protein [Novosphingobium terrae]|jgi:hypothetical protein|uniref:hypothetical protein n=1 Tax=Novosphingobium terrae TaxID=2726189 RepID=UPI00197F5037|nr:hypothetical protein [Novosphingobium terrae]
MTLGSHISIAAGAPVAGTPLEGVTPQLAVSSSPRELRSQAMQRLQVGLFGLALMLLLVGLANIIMDHAKANEAAMAASSKAVMTNSGGAAGNTDPLADISMMPDTAAKVHPAPHPAGH